MLATITHRDGPVSQGPSSQGFISYREAALYWFQFGYSVIPIIPGTKRPAVKWDGWLAKLSAHQVRIYWLLNPNFALGFIVGDDIIVFDADSAESIAALATIERKFGVSPSLSIKTAKGEHHYYRRAKRTIARSDSHCTSEYPDRIDIKTGRALVILPPSPGKEMMSCNARHVSELSEVGQDFVDAIFENNGRQAPHDTTPPIRSVHNLDLSSSRIKILVAILLVLDPDLGYDDWLYIGMVIHHETVGAYAGYVMFDEWSARGTKYKGSEETWKKWKSFRLDHERPVALATALYIAKASGIDVEDLISAALDPFESIVTAVQGDD